MARSAKKKTKRAQRGTSAPTARKKRAASRSSRRTGTTNDLIQLILRDHVEIRPLLRLIKNTGRDLDERWQAFERFIPLLVAHTKPEEGVLYSGMKQVEKLRAEGFEGEVEHSLVDQMVEEAKRERDEDILSAKMKVLADLVENHLEQEERLLLPHFKRASSREQLVELGQEFLRLKREIMAEGGDDSPREELLQDEDEDMMRASP